MTHHEPTKWARQGTPIFYRPWGDDEPRCHVRLDVETKHIWSDETYTGGDGPIIVEIKRCVQCGVLMQTRTVNLDA